MSRLNRFTLATAQRPHSILNRCFWVEMQGRHWRRYGTSVTLNDDEAANVDLPRNRGGMHYEE